MGKGGGGSAKASLVDPSAAMASYQKGADVIEQQFPIALANFQASANTGLAAQLEQYGKAAAEGATFSQTSKDAVNELRFMLGMPKLSESIGLSNQMQSLADGANAFTTVGSYKLYDLLGGIATQMQNAESLTDSAQRAAAKANIMKQITNVNNAIQNDMIARANGTIYYDRMQKGGGYSGADAQKLGGGSAIKPFAIGGNTFANGAVGGTYGFEGLPEGAKPEDYGYVSYLPTDISGPLTQFGVSVNQLVAKGDGNAQGTSTQQQVDEITADALQTELRKLATQTKSLGDTFNQQYSVEANKAPTGDEVAAKLEQTPGYQFNFQQGSKALERTQAARGILSSGNALIEANQFGQGLAEQTYQQQVQNLAQLAGINMPVTQQGIGNMTQLGQNLQNQYNGYGQAAQQSVQDIARSRESAFIRSGDAQLQAAMMNAQLQTQASLANAQMKQQSGMASMGGIGQLAGSLLGMFL